VELRHLHGDQEARSTSRAVFKHTTGLSRERVARAQQLIRESSRSLIEIALEVGYTSPSHFAQVFRRVVGVTPTEFWSTF